MKIEVVVAPLEARLHSFDEIPNGRAFGITPGHIDLKLSATQALCSMGGVIKSSFVPGRSFVLLPEGTQVIITT